MKKSSVIVIVCVVIALIVVGYFMFFYSVKCKDSECFSEKLVACSRASFVLDNPETVFEYSIIGEKEGRCAVNVKLLQVKKGGAELAILEDKEMLCFTELGALVIPEANIKYCHGLLKEAIQEITIERMHTQIFNNLEQLNNLTKII